MRYLFFILYCLVFFSQSSIAVEETMSNPVGKVVFILGKVQLLTQNAEGETNEQALQRGSEIYIGSHIVTSDRAQVGIRMIDGATLQIRENSNFSIQQYQYDAQSPQESAVKFFLQKGELNSKTGAAGKAAKHQYRLNTPIAAIGIRGTEFIVQTDSQHTRVNVLSGGVIVSPFNQSCALAGTGPCGGQNAVELFADHRNASLILQRNAVRPKIVTPVLKAPAQKLPSSVPSSSQNTTETPSVNANESSLSAEADAVSSDTAPAESVDVNESNLSIATEADAIPSDTSVASSSTASSDVVTTNDEASNTSTTAPLAKGAAPVEEKTSEPSVKWGRWNPDLADNQLAEGYELVAKNADYAIIRRASDNFVLPETGVYKFTPTRYEAYIRNVSQDEYTQAAIANAQLSINFVDRNFNTEFDLLAQGLNTHVQATGSLNEAGLFATVNDENSNTYINGAIGDENAKEASYAFYHQIDEDRKVAGAIDWSSANPAP